MNTAPSCRSLLFTAVIRLALRPPCRDAVTLEFDVVCLATVANPLHSPLELELQYGSGEYPGKIGNPDGMGYDAFAVTVDGTLISLMPVGGAPISAWSIHPVIPARSTLPPVLRTRSSSMA